jgi:hypothetical protein
MPAAELAEVIVNKRSQPIERLLVAIPPRLEEGGDVVVGRRLHAANLTISPDAGMPGERISAL